MPGKLGPDSTQAEKHLETELEICRALKIDVIIGGGRTKGIKKGRYPPDFTEPPDIRYYPMPPYPKKGVRLIAREVTETLGRGSPPTILRYLIKMKKRGLVVQRKKKWRANRKFVGSFRT